MARVVVYRQWQVRRRRQARQAVLLCLRLLTHLPTSSHAARPPGVGQVSRKRSVGQEVEGKGRCRQEERAGGRYREVVGRKSGKKVRVQRHGVQKVAVGGGR